MKFCPDCGSVMIRADLYDPEGTTPLYMVSDEKGQMWACIDCSEKLGNRNKNKGEKECGRQHTE